MNILIITKFYDITDIEPKAYEISSKEELQQYVDNDTVYNKYQQLFDYNNSVSLFPLLFNTGTEEIPVYKIPTNNFENYVQLKIQFDEIYQDYQDYNQNLIDINLYADSYFNPVERQYVYQYNNGDYTTADISNQNSINKLQLLELQFKFEEKFLDTDLKQLINFPLSAIVNHYREYEDSNGFIWQQNSIINYYSKSITTTYYNEAKYFYFDNEKYLQELPEGLNQGYYDAIQNMEKPTYTSDNSKTISHNDILQETTSFTYHTIVEEFEKKFKSKDYFNIKYFAASFDELIADKTYYFSGLTINYMYDENANDKSTEIIHYDLQQFIKLGYLNYAIPDSFNTVNQYCDQETQYSLFNNNINQWYSIVDDIIYNQFFRLRTNKQSLIYDLYSVFQFKLIEQKIREIIDNNIKGKVVPDINLSQKLQNNMLEDLKAKSIIYDYNATIVEQDQQTYIFIIKLKSRFIPNETFTLNI